MYEQNVTVSRSPPDVEHTILSDVKALLYIPDDHHEYDMQILAYINTILLTAYQIGLINDSSTQVGVDSLWTDVFAECIGIHARTWLALNVRQLFDPPQGNAIGIVSEAIEEQGYRLREQLESGVFNSVGD